MSHSSVSQPEGKNIRFSQEGLAAFGFLATDFDCRHVPTSGSNVIRFETKGLFVEVNRSPGHDPSVYFLGINLGRLKGSQERPLDLIDLARHAKPEASLSDLEKEAACRNFPASTPEQTRLSLQKLANLFKTYAKVILKGGGPSMFDKMVTERKRWTAENAKRAHLEEVRMEAEAAFKKKDYAETAKLYESIRDDLLPSEFKKLKYAKKYLERPS